MTVTIVLATLCAALAASIVWLARLFFQAANVATGMALYAEALNEERMIHVGMLRDVLLLATFEDDEALDTLTEVYLSDRAALRRKYPLLDARKYKTEDIQP
jgi:hypothetical protein